MPGQAAIQLLQGEGMLPMALSLCVLSCLQEIDNLPGTFPEEIASQNMWLLNLRRRESKTKQKTYQSYLLILIRDSETFSIS